jgi:hypothetical protein
VRRHARKQLFYPSLQEHTGRQCEDVEDTKLKAEHAVEDAMSEIERCPD